jgi:hypothetical protein
LYSTEERKAVRGGVVREDIEVPVAVARAAFFRWLRPAILTAVIRAAAAAAAAAAAVL